MNGPWYIASQDHLDGHSAKRPTSNPQPSQPSTIITWRPYLIHTAHVSGTCSFHLERPYRQVLSSTINPCDDPCRYSALVCPVRAFIRDAHRLSAGRAIAACNNEAVRSDDRRGPQDFLTAPVVLIGLRHADLGSAPP